MNKYKTYRIKDSHWLNTTKDYYGWKKAPEFRKWQKRQFLKQGGLCWYCQVFLPYTKVNVEHKLARSLGGGNNKNNLVLACSSCNREKGSKVLSRSERERLNKLNRNNKNTYLKNKEHFDNLYGSYSDEALYDKFKYL